ncbi:type I-F CRISPR-associated endoribonuclease Cas6/Csy4 [Pokkaliibacter sp. MBI-7]|uniref:type I-F CRISPR-associated endoribonuclease Cas6/Csy4 n=1 Tax=Pokkaliibacter sp. MBI-7 TaxID=3040600 RepID=UPI0024493B87|nr:type I-F CRISPR-associated endoribonuclease Cas6/Csy4 [Pokkaliibacter sp. MBI-7]MDH2434351.1 type I-F CRISPR-associated endoribonuclease Cas6/Csy4 [Pokkaliibacter sp. MBI-7]
MTHYLDIRLRPDPDFTASQLMSALYSKLHRALAAGEHQHIGVSFPRLEQQREALGSLLRLHGKAADLDQLMGQPWLTGMLDHVERSDINPVPAGVSYRALRRVQAKSNPERLRRRYMRRHGVTETEAARHLPDSAAKTLELPFIQMRSNSSGQHFRLFLALGEPQPQPTEGSFNSYGLSQSATLPWF